MSLSFSTFYIQPIFLPILFSGALDDGLGGSEYAFAIFMPVYLQRLDDFMT